MHVTQLLLIAAAALGISFVIGGSLLLCCVVLRNALHLDVSEDDAEQPAGGDD
jgi:hypothetical protein